jgi:hypothetical protein
MTALSRQNITGIGLGAAALTAVALAGANFIDAGDNGGVWPYAVTLAGSLLLALALFGWVIPRSERPARTGLIVGLLAILSLAAFWSGLPYVLGPAAVALGLLGRARGNRMQASIAIALGALATVGGVAAIVIDQAT